MANKKIPKGVLFYHLIPNPSLMWKPDVESATVVVKKALDIAFPEENHLYEHKFRKQQYRFQVLGDTKDILFGLFIKVDDPSEFMTQAQIRDEETKEATPIKFPAGVVLERYTFFAIDCDKLVMAVISCSYSSLICDALSDFLGKSGDYQVAILPYQIQNIMKKVELFKTISKIEMSFADPSKFRTLGELDGLDMDARKFIITSLVSRSGPKLASQLSRLNTGDYSKVKLTGISPTDSEFVVDLVKRTFTLSTKIEITSDEVKNYQEIRDLLVREIQRLSTDSLIT